jgi:isopenicillin-N epimerase
MYRSTKDMDGDPSFDNRRKIERREGRNATAGREISARHPRRDRSHSNTSEANNMVSSGLDLKAGDEVIVFADNHPSNNAAWTQKAKEQIDRASAFRRTFTTRWRKSIVRWRR